MAKIVQQTLLDSEVSQTIYAASSPANGTNMPDLIDFNEALKRTDGEDRTLLIGNGFSAEYFSYANLLDRSGLAPGTPVRNVFDLIGTVDFEAVVRALEGATIVERAYGNDAHAEELDMHAQEVREALVRAVNDTHPKHREDLGAKYVSSAAFLKRFNSVFSLNYDLLLYWVNLERAHLSDGFGLGDRVGSLHGPFSEDAHCSIFNLHGGLHLFQDAAGDVMKAVDSGAGVIATITNMIAHHRRFPIYVAEGNSAQKMRKINSVGYLRHCYDQLRRNTAAMFVYGHSADDNDVHIYRAIFQAGAKHLYFGVYKPDEERLKALDGILSKHQKTTGSATDYTFFDSESAQVWGS